eukprot:SAG11_NODE_29_length_23137_cov_16.739995_2_plen_241_part_00
MDWEERALVQCNPKKCREAENGAAKAPYHWLQLAMSSMDPVLLEIVLDGLRDTRVKRSETKDLENRLKGLLSTLHTEAPPAASEDEDVTVLVGVLGSSGRLLRRCWVIVEQADERKWSTRMNDTEQDRAQRWDNLRILFVEMFREHSKRVNIATITFETYGETHSVEEVRELLTVGQATELEDVSPSIGPVLSKLERLADHCEYVTELEGMMDSEDVYEINATLSKFIELSLQDAESLCE